MNKKKRKKAKISDIRVCHGKVTHGLEDQCDFCDEAKKEFMKDLMYDKIMEEADDIKGETTSSDDCGE